MIRKATADDIEPLMDLWRVLIDHHGELDPVYRRSRDGHLRFREWALLLMDAPDADISLAVDDGRPVGYCITRIQDYPPVFNLKKYAYLTDLAVDPSYRRKGHGRALAENAFAWARSMGVSRIELRVHTLNPSGLAFWDKMGYTEYVKVMYRDIP